MKTHVKPPTSFWIISTLALLWNLMGAYQFYLSTYELEALREATTPEEFSLMESLPSWYAIVFGVAVFSGVLGCILLLTKKKFAVPVFGVSLFAVLAIEVYFLIGTNILQVSGYLAAVMPILVIAVAIFLYYYSKGAARNGWLT
jgi:hypothetical protein